MSNFLGVGGLIILSDWDELFEDEHGERLPAVRDEEGSSVRGSWMARILNTLMRREDPEESVLRIKIRDTLQESSIIDPRTLQTALYRVPVGWDGNNIKDGALLGSLSRLDIMVSNIMIIIRSIRR